jgi:chemotaxis response regulator CheB
MKKINVMVVDDAAMMRMVIRSILEKDPRMNVAATCENGKVALDQIKTINPDVILLDIEMPVMDGLTFLRHARLMTKARVVVLSSVVGEGSEKALMAKKLGADAIVPKPSGSVSFDLAQKSGAKLLATILSLAS